MRSGAGVAGSYPGGTWTVTGRSPPTTILATLDAAREREADGRSDDAVARAETVEPEADAVGLGGALVVVVDGALVFVPDRALVVPDNARAAVVADGALVVVPLEQPTTSTADSARAARVIATLRCIKSLS